MCCVTWSSQKILQMTNLREEIMKAHSRSHALQIADYACKSRKNFKQLIDCFLDQEYRLAQRAAWSVTWAARKKPELIFPHIGALVSVLTRSDVHDAVIRNSVRILEEIDIPVKFHGQVMDACFRLVGNPGTAVAIKAFSLTTLLKLSKSYPEIRPELRLIIEDNWENAAPAFKARARKILSKI